MHRPNLVLTNGFTIGYRGHPVASVPDDIAIQPVPGLASISILTGSNGSGKTTLLRTLAGIIPSLAGGATLSDEPLEQLHRKGRLCYMPEILEFMPHLTPLQIFKALCPEHFHDVKRTAAAIDLSLASKAFNELSKGNRQKVRFLLTYLKAKPCNLLLLDEPFSGFDIESRQSAMTLLRDAFTDNGRRLIISLHTEQLPDGWCDSTIGLVDRQIRVGPAFHSVYDAQKYFTEKTSTAPHRP